MSHRRASGPGGTASRILLLIAIFCIVCLPQAEGNSGNVRAMLENYLVDQFPWAEIEVSNVQVMGTVPGGEPESITVEKGPLGNSIFSFRYSKGTRVTVKAYVKALDWIIKSKRPFRRGHVLSEEDMYLVTMDIRKMPRSAVRKQDSLIGKTLKRSIAANIPIVEDMVEKARAVKRGKRVILIVQRQGLNITVLGETREKAYVGMPVRAVNLSSRKEVRGVLIDEDTVKVEL